MLTYNASTVIDPSFMQMWVANFYSDVTRECIGRPAAPTAHTAAVHASEMLLRAEALVNVPKPSQRLVLRALVVHSPLAALAA